MEFNESVHWGLSWKSVWKNPVLLKLGKNYRAVYCIRWHYIAVKALPSKEAESGFLCSRSGINITRKRHNITYNVTCRLVINWPMLDLVTFAHSIYQHKCSRAWSVFLSPDGVTLDGMPHMRKCTIWFCTHHHRIDVAIVRNCFSATQIFVIVMPKRCLPQFAAFWYRLLTALRSRKTLRLRRFCESAEKEPEQDPEQM